MPYRGKFTRPSADEQERQGRIARIAWLSLPGEGVAVAFLNNFHEALDGRPIDLAIASEDGLRAVECAIQEISGDVRREHARQATKHTAD